MFIAVTCYWQFQNHNVKSIRPYVQQVDAGKNTKQPLDFKHAAQQLRFSFIFFFELGTETFSALSVHLVRGNTYVTIFFRVSPRNTMPTIFPSSPPILTTALFLSAYFHSTWGNHLCVILYRETSTSPPAVSMNSERSRHPLAFRLLYIEWNDNARPIAANGTTWYKLLT